MAIQGGWGPVAPPSPLFGVVFTKAKSMSKKNSIKQVQNLPQNAGNGHFQKFSKISGDYTPRPPRKLMPLLLVVPSPPFQSPGSASWNQRG